MKPKIERGIPIPPRITGDSGRFAILKDMKPGDSVLLTWDHLGIEGPENRTGLAVRRVSCYQMAWRHWGGRCITTRTEAGGLRVWRKARPRRDRE